MFNQIFSCLCVPARVYPVKTQSYVSMCAAGRMEGKLLTFAISCRLQPSFMSIKAIKRLSMWMEISMNYHISGRDWITSSISSFVLTPSFGCILSQIPPFIKNFRVSYDFKVHFGVFQRSKMHSGGPILYTVSVRHLIKYDNLIWKVSWRQFC